MSNNITKILNELLVYLFFWFQGQHFGFFLPVLIFGIMSFVAGAFAFFLPETKDKKLPDTVQQAEAV